MKKVISIILAMLIAVSMGITSFAATMGDVNGDGKVNSSDALEILKYTVGAVKTLKNQSAADVNKDGKINSTDALEVLKITVGISAKEPELTSYNGLKSNKVPYTCNGITITSMELEYSEDYDLLWMTVKNNTGKAISSDSQLFYKMYDENGVIIEASYIFLEDLNKGESCRFAMGIYYDTAKIVFYDAIANEGVEVKQPSLEMNDGIMSNKSPYTSNGISITSMCCYYQYDGTVFVATVKNNTGKAISSESYFTYKMYDENNTVINSGQLYLENLNKGESCELLMQIYDSVTKIVFFSAYVYDGVAVKEPKLESYYGIISNSVPYTSNGISITAIDFMYGDYYSELYVTVKNNTGAAIDGSSNIFYKMFDSYGTVIISDWLYLKDLNKGESCQQYIDVYSNVTKVVFYTAEVYEGVASPELALKGNNGILTNSVPYTSNGITITMIDYNSDYCVADVIVKNNCNHAISSCTNISYKVYDDYGYVIDSGIVFLEDLNKGESCSFGFDLSWIYNYNVGKIIFYNADVYEADSVVEPSLKDYNGIKSNKTPYTKNGLTITSIDCWEYDYGSYIRMLVRNDTGKQIDSGSTLYYKVYDVYGIVVDSGYLFVQDMDAGESCEVYLDLYPNVAKAYIYNVDVYFSE